MPNASCRKCGSGLGSGGACSYCGAVVLTPGHRFVASAPLSTHWERVTCREVDCPQWQAGFSVALDLMPGQNIGRFDATEMLDWLREQKRERAIDFTEERNGDLVTLKFEPGHECFDGLRGMHRQPIGADVINPGLVHARGESVRRHVRFADFKEDMNETNLAVSRGKIEREVIPNG